MSFRENIYTREQIGLASILIPEDAKAVNLVANGLWTKEISTRLGFATSTIKNRLSAICQLVGLRDYLQLALYWYRTNHFYDEGLSKIVNLGDYGKVSIGNWEVLEALVMNTGQTNPEIASVLGTSVHMVHNRLSEVGAEVVVGKVQPNRVAIAVGYERFLKSMKSRLVTAETLTKELSNYLIVGEDEARIVAGLLSGLNEFEVAAKHNITVANIRASISSLDKKVVANSGKYI